MKTYTIEVLKTRTFVKTFVVKADDISEAKDIALDIAESQEEEWASGITEYDILDTEEN